MRSALACLLVVLALAGCPGEDEPEFEPWQLEPLTPDQGFYFRTPIFEVPAGAEIQDCYFITVPDLGAGAELWIGKTVTAINPGSHHTNVFRVNTIAGLDPADAVPIESEGLAATMIHDGPCWNSAAWADWPLVANSQKSNPDDPYTTWELPAGVAHRFTPGELLMVQTHYVNATTQTAPFRGRVGINFYRTADAAPVELGTMFATQQSIRICRSNPTPTYHGTCSFPTGADVTITAANGHFHSRGERFSVFTWDGVSDVEPPAADRFYVSDTWDDPPMATGLDLPMSDGGIWWTCDYQWYEPPTGCQAVDERDPQQAGDCCYTFGGIVEYSEHCNVFLYYYPKVNSNDIFCN